MSTFSREKCNRESCFHLHLIRILLNALLFSKVVQEQVRNTVLSQSKTYENFLYLLCSFIDTKYLSVCSGKFLAEALQVYSCHKLWVSTSLQQHSWSRHTAAHHVTNKGTIYNYGRYECVTSPSGNMYFLNVSMENFTSANGKQKLFCLKCCRYDDRTISVISRRKKNKTYHMSKINGTIYFFPVFILTFTSLKISLIIILTHGSVPCFVKFRTFLFDNFPCAS